MSGKTLNRRRDARLDIEAASDYYNSEVGPETAHRFLEAVEATLDRIRIHPGTGSPRYAHIIGIADLRSRKIDRFPYLVFYIEQPDHIDVWRVLHAQRDIPATLGDADT